VATSKLTLKRVAAGGDTKQGTVVVIR